MDDKILISAHDLRAAQKENACLIVDCRFVLDKPDAAYEGFLKEHIPGAVYAHLDKDLSSPVSSISGRHPLPDSERFAQFLARSGWRPDLKLVAYDGAGGALAARLWWLMKYFGHNDSALLDGGFSAWKTAAYELESGPPSVAGQAAVKLHAHDELVLCTSDIIEGLGSESIVLVDARARERFMGEIEPIDSKAGHIPGALNYPFNLNLGADGEFKTSKELLTGLLTLNDGSDSRDMVHMCGSGVTACHNIFASELAGLKASKLYVGSWSEWIRDPSRPVEP